MPLAHACLGCGSDLARRRPTVEAIYGLAIARCDGCGRVAACGGWSIARLRRRIGRVGRTLFSLALHVIALLAITGGFVVGTVLVHARDRAIEGGIPEINLSATTTAVLVDSVIAIVATIAGFSFAIAFGHAWVRALIVVICMALLALHAESLEVFFVARMDGGGHRLSQVSWGWPLPPMLIVMAMATPGVLIGVVLRSVGAGLRSRAWRRRLSRRRTRRA